MLYNVESISYLDVRASNLLYRRGTNSSLLFDPDPGPVRVSVRVSVPVPVLVPSQKDDKNVLAIVVSYLEESEILKILSGSVRFTKETQT